MPDLLLMWMLGSAILFYLLVREIGTGRGKHASTLLYLLLLSTAIPVAWEAAKIPLSLATVQFAAWHMGMWALYLFLLIMGDDRLPRQTRQ